MGLGAVEVVEAAVAAVAVVVLLVLFLDRQLLMLAAVVAGVTPMAQAQVAVVVVAVATVASGVLLTLHQALPILVLAVVVAEAPLVAAGVLVLSSSATPTHLPLLQQPRAHQLLPFLVGIVHINGLARGALHYEPFC